MPCVKHEPDLTDIEYDKRGRRTRCKLCGCRLLMTMGAETRKGHERMSKKERLRRRREARTYGKSPIKALQEEIEAAETGHGPEGSVPETKEATE